MLPPTEKNETKNSNTHDIVVLSHTHKQIISYSLPLSFSLNICLLHINNITMTLTHSHFKFFIFTYLSSAISYTLKSLSLRAANANRHFIYFSLALSFFIFQSGQLSGRRLVDFLVKLFQASSLSKAVAEQPQ